MTAVTKKVVLGVLLSILLLLFLYPAAAEVRSFHIQETEFVKIAPEAIDADSDAIIYSYSPPLNQRGEWQTDYGDAGEYLINVTASDGTQETIEQIRLIVEHKNQAPYLTQNKITITEGEVVNVASLVTDPDDDPLQFTFSPPFDEKGRWQTGYDDEGNVTAAFTANDGEFSAPLRIGITVLHGNQPPIIADAFSTKATIKIPENSELEYWVEAEDEDPLTITWTLDGTTIGTELSGTKNFDFNAAGRHNLSVTVSDGRIEVYHDWSIIVENVNRKPEFTVLPVTVHEAESVHFDLPSTDADNDPITYSFKKPLDGNGIWQTTYDDAGTYTTTITASDGELSTSEKVIITVLDVDRAPLLTVPPEVQRREQEKVSFAIDSSDPDGDDITFSIEGLPEGALFDEHTKTIEWPTTFDTIRRKGGVISNILNSLRLERFLLRSRAFPVKITSCGKELCTLKTTTIIVYNVNRGPTMGAIAPVTLTETEKLVLKAHADDPDGDIVHYYFTKPLGKSSGEWQTTPNDQGMYTVYVTGTDGQIGDTIPVNITVLNKNQEPTIKIQNDDLVVNEGQEFTLRVGAEDPDGDNITLAIENLPPGASFADSVFVWNPPYDTVASSNSDWWNGFIGRWSYLNKKFNSEKAVVWLKFITSDVEFDVVHLVKVTVKNVNQPPEIVDYLPQPDVAVKLDEPVLFHVAVKDDDNDSLKYTWEFSPGEGTVRGSDTLRRTFVRPGIKEVKVTVSDGRAEIERQWTVQVLNEEFEEPQPAAPDPLRFKVYVIRG